MKKKIFYFLFLLSVFFLAACSTKEETQNKYLPVVEYDESRIAIHKEDITTTATFYNYEVEGTTIQLIAVKGTDGKLRIVYNTCQSCSPSPNAYFIQEGEYFICQNCQTKIHVDDLGESSFGCSPVLLGGQGEINDVVVIAKERIEQAKDRFASWQGITGI